MELAASWGIAEVAEPDIELEILELGLEELRKQDAEEGLYRGDHDLKQGNEPPAGSA